MFFPFVVRFTENCAENGESHINVLAARLFVSHVCVNEINLK